MKVIGTAGHVDHGKSALVHALTGIDPDRLQEEKDRQMTIDLGFAWLTLGNGEEVGIVDVPGHRDFIENMLAGVGGVDAAMLVIAADEGVMPQTREHLAILDLLQVKSGVIALTKTDLIDDPDWVNLVQEDIRALIAETSLAEAPILPVSAKRGTGLADLTRRLEEVLAGTNPRRDRRLPRLPIDRAFTISGFGTVVTGTLLDGSLQIGDEVEVLPSGQNARIRGLQTHKQKVELAVPGSRTAVNITGIEAKRIQRGDVLTKPGTYSSSRLMDLSYQHLSSVPYPLKHDQVVKLYIGAAQTQARVRVLGKQKINPGEHGWLQLVLDDPVVAERHDRYILRRPSPGMTLGGGQVVDPHPSRKHRRFSSGLDQKFTELVRGDPADVLAHTLQILGLSRFGDVVKRSGLEFNAASKALEALDKSGEAIILGDGSMGTTLGTFVGHQRTWQSLVEKMKNILSVYHEGFPLRMGIPREELKSKLKITPYLYSAIIERSISQGEILSDGSAVSLSGFKPSLHHKQKLQVNDLKSKFGQNPYSPPSVKEITEEIGVEVFRFLIEQKWLVLVSEDVVFSSESYEEMVEIVTGMIEKQSQVSVAEVRDRFGTSRKYALALMEHLDSVGVTERRGDVRVLSQTTTKV